MIALLAALLALQDPPVVHGRIIPSDTVDPGPRWAVVEWRDPLPRTDSAAVDSLGRFAVPLPAPPADSVSLRLRGGGAYHDALLRLPVNSLAAEHAVVLVPRTWRVTSGAYAGRSIPISPARARTAECDGCSAFWPASVETQSGTRFRAWSMASFPLRVAFDREYSLPRGAAPDSAAFWRIVRTMEDVFGMDLFRPAPYGETAPEDDDTNPDDVLLVLIDPRLRSGALTTMTSQGGNVSYGTLRFERASLVTGPDGAQLVMHELLHALGLGHTCEWRSVAADATRCSAQRAELPTLEDVAYTQVLYRVRNLQAATGARWALDAALAAETESVPRR